MTQQSSPAQQEMDEVHLSSKVVSTAADYEELQQPSAGEVEEGGREGGREGGKEREREREKGREGEGVVPGPPDPLSLSFGSLRLCQH